MKKNDKIYIRISTEIKKRLKREAEDSGLSLASYCLWILTHAKRREVYEEIPE